jgi:hypothetical protein
VQQFDCWAIASKNVCLLANHVKDIDRYDGGRYSFAGLIARQVFKQFIF